MAVETNSAVTESPPQRPEIEGAQIERLIQRWQSLKEKAEKTNLRPRLEAMRQELESQEQQEPKADNLRQRMLTGIRTGLQALDRIEGKSDTSNEQRAVNEIAEEAMLTEDGQTLDRLLELVTLHEGKKSGGEETPSSAEPETSPSTTEQEPGLFPETEPTPPPPPPPAMIQIEGLQVLGALAADIGPSNSRALDERIQRHLDRFDAQLDSTDSKTFNEAWGRLIEARDGIVMTVARKLGSESEQGSEQNQELDLTAAKMRLNEKLASLLDASEAEKRQFDDLVRGAVIEQVIATRTVDIEKRLQKELDRVSREIERNNPGRGKESKLRGFLEIAGATAVGMAVRNLVVNAGLDVAGRWAVDAGVGAATRALSGASGAIAGGVVGGALGALKAEREAMRQTYAYSNVDARIKAEQARLTEQARALGRETPVINEAEALIQLIERGDLRADTIAEIGVIREKINEYHRLQAQEELKDALETVKQSVDSERWGPEENLARAYIALLDAHREGSEKNRTNSWDRCWHVLGVEESKLLGVKKSTGSAENFTTGLRRDVLKQTGWGALKGALWGAGIGGFIGAVWPPASMFAKVGAEAATHNPLFQEAARALREGALDPAKSAQTSHAVDILVKNFKLDMFDKSTKLFEGHNLHYWAEELVKKAGTGENGLRALHQLLSYPAETIQAAGGIDQLIELVKNGGISGPDLTNSLLHGGAGVDQQALAAHLNTYLQREGIAHWLWRGGAEVLPGTPLANNNWQNMAGFILSSMGARYASTHQVTQEAGKAWGKGKDWVKEKYGTQEEETPDKEEKKKKPNTFDVPVDDKILNEFEENPAERSEIRKTLINTLGGAHGRFFIVSGQNGPRIFRVWTRETDLANAYNEVGNVHAPRMQQDNPERTGVGVGAYDYDPDLIAQGKIWVVEYPNISVFAPDKGVNGPEFAAIGNSWDRDNWDTQALLRDGKHKRKMDIREIFRGKDIRDAKVLRQTFIHPTEIEMYVYAVDKIGYPPGQPIRDAKGNIIKGEQLVTWVKEHSRTQTTQPEQNVADANPTDENTTTGNATPSQTNQTNQNDPIPAGEGTDGDNI